MSDPAPTALGVLLSWASPEVLAKARERAGCADDETLTLLLAKVLNPFVVLTETEEQKLRQVGRDALRNYKTSGQLQPIA